MNGVCRIPIGVCANVTGAPSCTPSAIDDITVDHALDNGDRAFDPDFQALQTRIDSQIQPPTSTADVCAEPIEISVPIRGPDGRGTCRRSAKLLFITTRPPLPDTRFDRDRLRLECEPAVCDPTILFAGTFDRLQSQVFDARCATSGCHDSQSLRGGLTLESGTAYAALVDVIPNNSAASAVGWRRVTPGSTSTSLLFHKLIGPPGEAYGERMPFGKPRLPSYLIDIVAAWIQAGAPETGWVEGTD